MRILWRTNIIKFKKLGLKKVQGKYKYFNTSTVLTSMWRSWAHGQFSHVENIKSRCASQINSCEHLRNNAISKQFCIHYSRVEINRKYFLTFF